MPTSVVPTGEWSTRGSTGWSLDELAGAAAGPEATALPAAIVSQSRDPAVAQAVVLARWVNWVIVVGRFYASHAHSARGTRSGRMISSLARKIP